MSSNKEDINYYKSRNAMASRRKIKVGGIYKCVRFTAAAPHCIDVGSLVFVSGVDRTQWRRTKVSFIHDGLHCDDIYTFESEFFGRFVEVKE